MNTIDDSESGDVDEELGSGDFPGMHVLLRTSTYNCLFLLHF